MPSPNWAVVVIEPVSVIVSVPEFRVHDEVTAVLIIPPLEVHCAIDEVLSIPSAIANIDKSQLRFKFAPC